MRDEGRFGARTLATRAAGVTGPVVAVMVDGRLVTGATSQARLVNGRVVAPVAPYVDAIATADGPAGGGALRVSNAHATVVVRTDVFGRVALGAVARALGERVDFDPTTRTLAIETPAAALRPFAAASAGPGRRTGAAFAAPGDGATEPVTPGGLEAAPTPKPTVDGIPQPRRTPIEAGLPGDGP